MPASGVSVAFLWSYSPSAEDHFYTTNTLEMENAVTHLGYKSEGDAGHVFSLPSWGDDTEADNAVDKLGYTAKGTAAFIYSDQICGSIPFYRMYSPTVTDHFYTTSESERETMPSPNLEYINEDIQCYILPTDD